MEVVKEDVVDAVAGKGVHQSPQESIIGVADKPPDIPEAGGRRRRDLQHHQRRHQVRHRPARERDGQPEKGRPQKIKGVGADEVGTEVGVPVPAHLPRPDHVVAHLVEGDLLDVVVAVVDKNPLVDDQEGKVDDGGKDQGGQKHRQVLPAGAGFPQKGV